MNFWRKITGRKTCDTQLGGSKKLKKIGCVYRILEKQKESNRVQMIETAALSIYTINPAFFASFQFTYNASTL